MSRLNSLSLEEFGRRRCGPRYRAGARSHGGCDLAPLGACPNSHGSIMSESDSSLGYEQVFSPLVSVARDLSPVCSS